jgi:hypothetical protein
MTETRRERYQKQVVMLDGELQSFLPAYRDLSDHFSPRRARFYTSDVNKGDRRNQKILNCDPVLAVKTLRAGMMGGLTSKSRPWFKYTIADQELSNFGSVKRWLHQVTEIIRASFARSNVYNTLNMVYGDLGVYGTAPFSFEENFDKVFHSMSFPVGSYRIAQDEFGRVNTFSRDYKMTVRQAIHKFGVINEDSGKIDFKNISGFVKDAWEQGNYEYWIGVSHMIQPNDYYEPERGAIDSKFKRFASCYWETGSSTGGSGTYDTRSDRDVFLSERGYQRFPILCPRWERTGEDPYATDSPGMTSIGDNKQLQYGEKRSAEVIEKKVRPPMVAPTSLKNAMVNQLPGGVTWVDSTSGSQKFEPAFNVVQDIGELEEKQRKIESRIDRSFYVDLFRMYASIEDRERTARENDYRNEERLQALGPVIEQIDLDQNDPMLDLAFDYHIDQRLLPPPPKELQGHELKVEYMSAMHLAQKALGVGTIERFARFVGEVGAVDTSVYKKVNTGKMVEIYADSLGVPPDIMRTDEEVEEIDAQMQAAQQKAERMQMIQQGAETAKTLSETDVEQPSALKSITQQLNGGQPVAQAS